MNSETFGEKLKHDIEQMERRLEAMGQEFGKDTNQYKQTTKVLEAKRMYLESMLGQQAVVDPRGECRG